MGADLTKDRIRRGLEQLGLGSGCAVVVHSSLSSFGHVVGGPESVAAAVVEAVGPEGLVVMPLLRSSVDAHGDLLRVPSPSAKVATGAIPPAFAALAEVRVATHPIYSNAFCGRDTAALSKQHSLLMFPYGSDQPLHCLHSRMGCIMQLGVDDETNTSIHAAEEIADPPYLAEKKSQSRLTVDEFFQMPLEARRASLAHHRAGPRRDFRKVTALIEQAGLRRTVRIGQCRAALTDFVGMCELLIAEIRRDPNLLVISEEGTATA